MAKNATQSQGTLVSPTIDEADSGWMMATLYLHSDSGHNFNEWSAAKGKTMCGTMSSIPGNKKLAATLPSSSSLAVLSVSGCPQIQWGRVTALMDARECILTFFIGSIPSGTTKTGPDK